MEHRIQQLELKLAEQERVNAAMSDDIRSLKEIQNGDRRECQEGFKHHETKKKKLFALFGEVNTRVAALQDQQESMATKAEFQYVHTILRKLPGLTSARSLLGKLDDLKSAHSEPCSICIPLTLK